MCGGRGITFALSIKGGEVRASFFLIGRDLWQTNLKIMCEPVISMEIGGNVANKIGHM